jgi:hypothetical protein
MRFAFLVLVIFLMFAATQPTTSPSDPTMDWIFSNTTTAPAPTTEPVPTTIPSVLTGGPTADDARPGAIILSDGKTIQGNLSTTLDQPIRVWNDQTNQYQDVPFSLIKSIEAQVVWERMEDEWKFQESGSDIKEYSGKQYPARLTAYTITTTDGQSITGGVVAPIYVDTPTGRRLFILHKRDKGDVGQSLKDLVYVQSVKFSD